MALADLGEAEASLFAGLFDRSWPEIDPRESAVSSAPRGAIRIGRHPAPAIAGLRHAGSLAEIT